MPYEQIKKDVLCTRVQWGMVTVLCDFHIHRACSCVHGGCWFAHAHAMLAIDDNNNNKSVFWCTRRLFKVICPLQHIADCCRSTSSPICPGIYEPQSSYLIMWGGGGRFRTTKDIVETIFRVTPSTLPTTSRPTYLFPFLHNVFTAVRAPPNTHHSLLSGKCWL